MSLNKNKINQAAEKFQRQPWLSQLLGGLGLFFVGIMLIAFKQASVGVITVVAGAVCLFNGVSELLVLKRLNMLFIRRAGFFRVLVKLVIGVMATVAPLCIADLTWSLLMFLIGGYLLVEAIFGLLEAFSASDTQVAKQSIPGSVVLLCLALFMFSSPKVIGQILSSVLGFALMIGGALIVTLALYSHKHPAFSSSQGNSDAQSATVNGESVEVHVVDDED